VILADISIKYIGYPVIYMLACQETLYSTTEYLVPALFQFGDGESCVPYASVAHEVSTAIEYVSKHSSFISAKMLPSNRPPRAPHAV
jgi:hypothetical protein